MSKKIEQNQSHQQNTEALKEVFHSFNSVSEQLFEAYGQLQKRVEYLSDALERSERASAEENNTSLLLANRLSCLLQALPIGVIVIDGQGILQTLNPAAGELLGSNWVGCHWSEVIESVISPYAAGMDKVVLNNGRIVSIRTCPLGQEPGQIVVISDETETHKLHNQLNHHQRLSAMGEMAANLAHQIRTPLSSALLYASHLNQDQLSQSDYIRFSGKVLARLKHLERTVQDMLMFARGGEESALEAVDADVFLDNLRESLESQIHTSQTVVEFIKPAASLTFYANSSAIQNALENLIVNALQACGPDDQVKVECGLAKNGRLSEVLVFKVIDSGPGMDAATVAKMYQPFFTTKPKGTGLGLSVVRAIAQSHGGGVACESEPGQGTIFSFYLPLRNVPGCEIDEAQAAAYP